MADREPSPSLLASSTQRKPHVSITLPRNFAPLGLGSGDDPKTPDQTFAELKLPPPPHHHSTCRGRRPRVNMHNYQAYNNTLPPTLFASEIPIPSSALSTQTEFPSDADMPIPSIEPPSRPLFQQSLTDPSPSERLRLPNFRDQLPRTPVAQTKLVHPEFKQSVWDMRRSSSECSLRSNSSTSSGDAFTTRPTSFDGSITSPEADFQDPFSHAKVNIIPDTPSRKSKKLRVNSLMSKGNVQWSIEMDNHLFNIYQMYLADPTVTPFKTVPGSIPPTGVCHRVARRAKETWPKASLVSKPIIQRYKVRNLIEKRSLARDKTPEPNDFLRTDAAETKATWPSESATRRRLKQLCKEKFTISAHYQRLRESRSPSPFHDQFLRKPSRVRSVSREPESSTSAAYATRELGISLVATGATAPLAQLVTGNSPPAHQMSDGWFNTPVTEPADSMQLSSPAGLGIDTDSDKLKVGGSIPRLASPFNYSTWNGSSNNEGKHRRHISHNQFDTVHATGSRLLSPFKLEPDVSLNVNKRRAQHNLEDELSPNGSSLSKLNSNLTVQMPEPINFEPTPENRPELVFTGAGDINQRRIRMRNRGATLGAVNTAEKLQRFFTPPTLHTENMSDAVPPVPALPPSFAVLANSATDASSSSLAPPEVDPTQKRLGSPFELDPNKRSYRQKNPRHVPSLSDPFISTNAFAQTQNMSQSIEERMAMFSSFHALHRQNQEQARDDPFT